MRDNYLERLEIGRAPYRGGYVNLNEQIKGEVVEDVISITFDSLYPRLLLYFYDNGIFDSELFLGRFHTKSFNDTVFKLRDCYDNIIEIKKSGSWQDTKVWMNSLWSKELRAYSYEIFDLFSQYMEMFYTDIIANAPYNWLYIDVDVMYVAGDEGMVYNLMRSVIPSLKFTIEKLPFVFFEAKKRYVVVDSTMLLKDKGFISRNTLRKEEIVSIMKEHIRNRRLNDILC